MNQGIDEFYYARTLPPQAVAIAAITSPAAVASELIDSASPLTTSLPAWGFQAGWIGVWNADPAVAPYNLAAAPQWAATGPNLVITIAGSRTYSMGSQFFELTDTLAADGITPLFYKSPVATNADSISILDPKMNLVDTPTSIAAGYLYHSLPQGLYWTRYVDTSGNVQTELLKFMPAVSLDLGVFPQQSTYTMSGSLLTVYNATPYCVRFTGYSCFQVLSPYDAPANTPWFPRVRFSLTPPVPEWAQQNFAPQAPYLLASWVPGTILDSNVVQFERTQVYPDTTRYPDILVFDKNYVFKYALEGTDPNEGSQRGTSYPWKRNQIADMDDNFAIVQIVPTLDPTDIVFGFYCYREQDLLFTGIDCNPFTNPALTDCVVRFYTRLVYTDLDTDPFRHVFFQVINYAGADVPGANNDPNPVAGDWSNPAILLIGDLFIGANIGAQNVQVTDIRVRGGGLSPASQDIPQSANFWDIGFLDGEPYPIGGALVVYLPYSILDTMTREEISARIAKTIPLGALAVVRYIDSNLQEWV